MGIAVGEGGVSFYWDDKKPMRKSWKETKDQSLICHDAEARVIRGGGGGGGGGERERTEGGEQGRKMRMMKKKKKRGRRERKKGNRKKFAL